MFGFDDTYLDLARALQISPRKDFMSARLSDLVGAITPPKGHGSYDFEKSCDLFEGMIGGKIFLIAQEQKMSIPVLSKEGDSWLQSDLLDEMPDNAIINESIRLYEEEVEWHSNDHRTDYRTRHDIWLIS